MRKSKSLLLLIAFGIFAAAENANAKVTLLPDYIKVNPFKDRVNERTAQKYQTLCENYAGVTQAYAQSHGLVCNKVFSPAPNLTCYSDCGCDISYTYTTANCRADEGRKLGGGSCNGLYKECNCDTTIYTYSANDSRCPSKKFTGVCKGSNGTFYRACDNPCEGLTEANCVVNGVNLGCAETYGNGCNLCKSCNNNTCDLPENANKPLVATECNGCTTLVPGCSSKCESGCGKCEANCSGYRYDSPSAIPYVNETYDCVMCGGSTKYKAKSCVSGYKVDDLTGGCVPMDCDEHLKSEGYAIAENATQFQQAVSSGKPIVIKKSLTASGNYNVTQNIYDYKQVKTLGFNQCAASSAKLTAGTLNLNKSSSILEVYPELAATNLNINGNAQFYGGISGTPSAITLKSGITASLLGSKTYAAGSKLSGAGTVAVGPASTLNASNTNMSVSKLKLQIGGCAIQNTFEICGGTSEADISFSGSPSYLPSRCSTGSWTNGKTTCKGSISTNCSVGSMPVDMRFDTDRGSACMITANTRVATPMLASGGQESYSLLSGIPEANRKLYCVRCGEMDGCDQQATSCYRMAEDMFDTCFDSNRNPSYCMGTVVKTEKDKCDATRRVCRGEDSCAVQWAEGKSGTVVVKNAEDLAAAVAQSNIHTVVVEGDIELGAALSVPAGKTLLGAAGETVGCPCDLDAGDCSTGKYRLLVNSDANGSSAGIKKLTVTGSAVVRELGIETFYRDAINTDTAAVYVNSAAEVLLDSAYIEGNEGYGIKDVSSNGSAVRLSGLTVVNGTTAVKGKTVSAANTGTKLIVDTDAQIVVTGYDKGIDGIETLKMTPGVGGFSKLRVNAKTLGISLYNTDGASTPFSYVDLAIEGGKALVFKDLSGVNPVWPYNTKVRMEGNSWGIFSEGNRTLTMTGDADIKSTATASSSVAVESEGSLTISNEGYTGEGVVRLEAYTAHPLIKVKNIFEANSYLMLTNISAGGTGIRAGHVTFGMPKCYKPMGSINCEGFFSKSADITTETAIEIISGTSAVNGQLAFKAGADININATVGSSSEEVAPDTSTAIIPSSKGIVLNANTGMSVEAGSAVNIETVKGVVSADAGVVSNIAGDFSVTTTESSFSGGTQNISGALSLNSPAGFVGGSKATFASNGVLMVNYGTVNIATDTSKVIMPQQSLLTIYFEGDDESGVSRNTLLTNGLYGFGGTQLVSTFDGETMLYSITSNCAASEDACSMSTFKLENYINSLGGGSGTESDSKGNSLTKLTSCSSLFSRGNCDRTVGEKSIVCPYDVNKMKCYGVINSNRSLAEISGQTLPLSYFNN